MGGLTLPLTLCQWRHASRHDDILLGDRIDKKFVPFQIEPVCWFREMKFEQHEAHK